VLQSLFSVSVSGIKCKFCLETKGRGVSIESRTNHYWPFDPVTDQCCFRLKEQPNTTQTHYLFKGLQCQSNPLKFSDFFPNGREFLVQILHAYYTFLSMLDYKFLFNYLQLWRSYATLSATTIMCSKCPPSTETHAGRSHLIWHNFVTAEDNWTKICILAYIRTFNRRLKFWQKNS